MPLLGSPVGAHFPSPSVDHLQVKVFQGVIADRIAFDGFGGTPSY